MVMGVCAAAYLYIIIAHGGVTIMSLDSGSCSYVLDGIRTSCIAGRTLFLPASDYNPSFLSRTRYVYADRLGLPFSVNALTQRY